MKKLIQVLPAVLLIGCIGLFRETVPEHAIAEGDTPKNEVAQQALSNHLQHGDSQHDGSQQGDTGQPSMFERARFSMESRAAEILENPVISAVSVGVYKDGVSYTGHYGELDPGMGNPPSDLTLYEIASVSKTFTGTLAAQAVLDGKIRLEDDIRDYLSGDYPNLEFKGEPIRIKHLVTHTGGLPANNRALEEVSENDEDGLQWKRLYEAERNYSKEEFFEHLSEINIESEPGTSFLYSNVSANVMGHILENAYGKTFGELLREKVFEKAGMVQTKLHLNTEEQGRLALGYNGQGQAMPPLPLADVLWGAEGGLKSTLPDMLRYAEFQLGNSAVTNESHRRLHQLDDGYWIGYFWWAIDVEDGIISYRHDGGAIGTRSVFIIYPSYDLGIYVVTNNASESIFPSLTTLSQNLLHDLAP